MRTLALVRDFLQAVDELEARKGEATRQLALLDDGVPELRQGFSNQQASHVSWSLKSSWAVRAW